MAKRKGKTPQGKAQPLTPEQAATLAELHAAGEELKAREAALSPEELAAIKAEWAGFRAKVESGAGARPFRRKKGAKGQTKEGC
jgi:hypothetical protein